MSGRTSFFAPIERGHRPAQRIPLPQLRGWGPGCATGGLVPDGTAPGYALLAVMLMATLLLIALTVALPHVYQEGQREREEELIFRGIQYARAIDAFHRQFQRFPTDVKELLQTNRIRFLRQAYPDPMSEKGKWRFIHATAAGTLIDSKLQGFSPNPAGSMAAPGGLSQNPTAGSPFGTSSQTSSGADFGTSSQTSSGSSSGTSSQTSSAFSGQGQELKGAFIVGVASTSTKQSIRVYNKRTRYDEWEFLGVALYPFAGPGGTFTGGQVGGAQGPSGSTPGGAMGQPGAPGQPTNPTGPTVPPQPTGPDLSGQQPPPTQ